MCCLRVPRLARRRVDRHLLTDLKVDGKPVAAEVPPARRARHQVAEGAEGLVVFVWVLAGLGTREGGGERRERAAVFADGRCLRRRQRAAVAVVRVAAARGRVAGGGRRRRRRPATAAAGRGGERPSAVLPPAALVRSGLAHVDIIEATEPLACGVECFAGLRRRAAADCPVFVDTISSEGASAHLALHERGGAFVGGRRLHLPHRLSRARQRPLVLGNVGRRVAILGRRTVCRLLVVIRITVGVAVRGVRAVEIVEPLWRPRALPALGARRIAVVAVARRRLRVASVGSTGAAAAFGAASARPAARACVALRRRLLECAILDKVRIPLGQRLAPRRAAAQR